LVDDQSDVSILRSNNGRCYGKLVTNNVVINEASFRRVAQKIGEDTQQLRIEARKFSAGQLQTV